MISSYLRFILLMTALCLHGQVAADNYQIRIPFTPSDVPANDNGEPDPDEREPNPEAWLQFAQDNGLGSNPNWNLLVWRN